MKLYAARHGETTWNVERRLMGQLPGNLSAKGQKQAIDLAVAVARADLNIAYASDLNRVRQTVAAVQRRAPNLR